MLEYRYWLELKKGNDLRDFHILLDFAKSYPATEREYQQRLKQEEAERSKIMEIKDREKRIGAIKENLGLFGVSRRV